MCGQWMECGNGKGLIDDLLLIALGNYAIKANTSIFFETSKQSSNPEKANLHKKRLVLYTEPPQRKKFENSIIKDLTGGGNFSARTLYEKETVKKLHATTICECNNKPKFAEEPTNGEIRRLIDIHFPSEFTTDKNNVNPEKLIFEAKIEFKEYGFQENHKFALIKILMDAHINYTKKNFVLDIPPSVQMRTNEYLESSCELLGWLKEHYEIVENDDKIVHIVSLHDAYLLFKESEYYFNLSKQNKRSFTYQYFCTYFSRNICTKKYFKKKYDSTENGVRKQRKNVLINWQKIDNAVEESDQTSSHRHGHSKYDFID